MSPHPTKKPKPVVWELDEKIYARPVILSAAYGFTERCYVRLERRPNHRVKISLKPKPLPAGSQSVPQSLREEFENELVHQAVRNQVATHTTALREIIVGRALWAAEPITPEATSACVEDLDYLEDPLGIAVPWEEKYGDPGKEQNQ